MDIQALWASHFSASLNELKETFLKLKVSKLTGEGFFCSLILTSSGGENGETASEAEWNELWLGCCDANIISPSLNAGDL